MAGLLSAEVAPFRTGPCALRRRTKKPTVETCPLKLSIFDLRRGGVLQPEAQGELRKTGAAGRVATVFFKTFDDTLELRYRVGPVGAPSSESWEVEVVTLLWTPCYFGGRRPWFRCPGIIRPCARRVGVLYGTGTYFLCRRCSGLVYQSQHEGVEGRAALRVYRLRARLRDYGDLLDPLPKRPPGMHHRTYQRLCDEIEAAEDVAFFGDSEASANGAETEARTTTGTNQNQEAVSG